MIVIGTGGRSLLYYDKFLIDSSRLEGTKQGPLGPSSAGGTFFYNKPIKS